MMCAPGTNDDVAVHTTVATAVPTTQVKSSDLAPAKVTPAGRGSVTTMGVVVSANELDGPALITEMSQENSLPATAREPGTSGVLVMLRSALVSTSTLSLAVLLPAAP